MGKVSNGCGCWGVVDRGCHTLDIVCGGMNRKGFGVTYLTFRFSLLLAPTEIFIILFLVPFSGRYLIDKMSRDR